MAQGKKALEEIVGVEFSSPSSNSSEETPKKKSLDDIIGGAFEKAEEQQDTSKKKTLDDILDEALKEKTSNKEKAPEENVKQQKSLDDILSGKQDDTSGYPEFDRWYELVQYEQMNNVRLPESVRKATEEKERQWKEQQQKSLREQKIENPTWWDKTKAVGANFIEEFLFGWDLFAIDDRVELSSFGEGASTWLGAMANQLTVALLVTTGTTLGLKALTTKLKFGGNLFKVPAATSGVGKALNVGKKVVATGAKSSVEGALVGTVTKALAPEERKELLPSSGEYATKFASGNMAQEVAASIMEKFLPGYGGKALGRAILGVTDAIGEVIGSYAMGYSEDWEDIKDELLSPETVAFVLTDMILFSVKQGFVARNKEVDIKLRNLEEAHNNYMNNKSVANEASLWEAISEVWGTIDPSDTEAFADILTRAYKGEAWADIERSLNVESAKNVSSQALAERILFGDGMEATPLEAEHLAQATPRQGDAVNTKLMDVSDDARKLAQTVGTEVKDTTPVRWADTIFEAKKYLNDPELLKYEAEDLAKALSDAPAKLHALREFEAGFAEAVIAEGERLRALGPELTQQHVDEFIDFVELYRETNALLTQIKTDTARTLNIAGAEVSGVDYFRFLLDDTGKPLAYDDVTPIASTVEAEVKTTVTKDVEITDAQKTIDRLIESIQEEQLKDKDLLPPFRKRLSNALLELRANNLLGQIKTATKNMAAQTLNAINEITTNFVASGYDTLGRGISKVRGLEWDGGISAREAAARAAGHLEGMIRGIYEPIVDFHKLAKVRADVLGEPPPTRLTLLWDRLINPKKVEQIVESLGYNSRFSTEGFSTKYISSEYLFPNASEVPLLKPVMAVLDWVGAQVRLSGFGNMEIADMPFAAGGYYDGLAGELVRRVESGSLTPEAAQVLKQRTLAYREYENITRHIEGLEKHYGVKIDDTVIARHVHDITDGQLKGLTLEELTELKELHSIAMQKSDHMTYKDEIQTKTLRKFEEMRRDNVTLKLLLPFYHTPTRIMENWFYKSPIYLPLWRDAFGMTLDANGKVDRQRQTKALGQITVASALYALGAWLWADGRLTPTARNADERKAFREAGMPESSLRVGDDTWVQFNGLDPLGMFLGTSANVARAIAEARTEEEEMKAVGLALEFITTLAQSVVSESWATTLREGLQLITSGSLDEIWNFAKRNVNTFNPLQPHYNNVTSISMFGLNPLYEQNFHDINWRTLETKPRLDTFGKFVVRYEGTNFGVSYSHTTDSAIRQEIVKYNIRLKSIPKVYKGVELTEDEIYGINRYLETVVHAEDMMNLFITGPQSEYHRLTNDAKVEAIQNKWRELLDLAVNGYLMSNPDFLKRLGELDPDSPDFGKTYRDKWFE